MRNSKKTSIFAGATAVALVAALAIGGTTMSYLQDTSETVTNNFDANEVNVTLDETTGEDYNIIPGEEEAKDPTVTVKATVDSYVFVTVTDATQGLVGYTIADGWKLLSETTDEDDVTTYVYYREVSVADNDENGEQVFGVLDGDTVTYDSSLTNEAMYDEDGNLLEDLILEFSADAIQQSGFDTAADAWEYLTSEKVSEPSDTTTYVSSVVFNGTTVESGLAIDITRNVKNMFAYGTTFTLYPVDDNGRILNDADEYYIVATVNKGNGSSETITVSSDSNRSFAYSSFGLKMNLNTSVEIAVNEIVAVYYDDSGDISKEYIYDKTFYLEYNP